MGTGIAVVASRVAGLNVKVIDINESLLSKSRQFTESLLEKEIAKGRLSSEDRYKVLERISYSTKMEDLENTEFIVEAINESVELKEKVFRELDQILPAESILASNTSSISITKIGGFTKRPSKVIGMHFMNPVPVMNLVEVIKGLQTSNETLETTLELAQKMKKDTVNAQDYPGFILNRVLMPYINEACFCVYENIATIEDIDKGLK